MSGFTKRVALATIDADTSALRWSSALRRAAVVMTVLVVGTTVIGIDSAVNAATSAFLIGLLDKGTSPRQTWHLMAIATGFLCLVTFTASLLSWSVPAMMLLLLILAFSAGVSPGVDPRATPIIIFGALTIAAHLVSPITSDKVWAVTALVAVAGGLQTLFAWISSPIIGDLPERREVAAALRAVGMHCQAIGRGDPDDLEQGAPASRTLGIAENSIRKGDLATEHRARYAVLLANLDIIRLEARAYSTRTRLGLPRPPNLTTPMVFFQVGEILELAANILTKRRIGTQMLELEEHVTRLRSAYLGRSTTKIAAATLEATYALPTDLHEIVDDHSVRREHQSPSRPLTRRLRESLAWGSTPLKHGARMAAGVFVAEAIAVGLQLPHSSWVAVTTIMLLRPDGGPTAPRILMRAIGTTLAVGLMLGVLWLAAGSSLIILAFIAGALVATYAVVAVNYSAQTAMTTMSIVLMLSLSYANPTELLSARWLDVIIGCAIGSAFAFAWPLWERVSLAQDTAAYADAVSNWFRTIALAAATSGQARVDAMANMRSASAKARGARQTADATFHTALLEPPDVNHDAGSVGVVMTWIRRSSDAAVTAETMLRHEAPGSELAVELAGTAADDLSKTAGVLRSGTGHFEIPEELLTTSSLSRRSIDHPDDRVTSVLARSELSASAALRASYRVGTKE